MNKIVEMPNWMLFGEYGIHQDSCGELLRKCDAATLGSCASVSKNWYEVVNAFIPISRPHDLIIFTVELSSNNIKQEQPNFDRLKVLEFVKKLGPKIENDANCMVMPMFKGMTVSYLCEIANCAGMTVEVDSRIFGNVVYEADNFIKEDTYCIAITNALLENSRNLSYEERKLAHEKTMKEVGIDARPPSVQELIAFNIFSFMHGKHFFANSFAASSFVRDSGELHSVCVGRTAPEVILITLADKPQNFGSALCKDV